MERKNKIGKMAAVIALAGFCLVTVMVATAYFTDSAAVENRFRTADPKVGLQETDWSPEEGDGQNMYPGYLVYKNPTVKNLSADGEKVYTRMIVTVRDEDGNRIDDEQILSLIRSVIFYDDTYTGTYNKKGQGEKLTEGSIPGYSMEELKEIPMINPVFRIDEGRTNGGVWTFIYKGKQGDGILNPGEEAVLFTDIVIPVDWTLKEIETVGGFILDVSQESIQTVGFKNQSEAFAALDQSLTEGGR